MELRGRADARDDGVAIGARALFQRVGIVAPGAGHGEVHDGRGELDAVHAEAIDDARRAAAGRGDDETFPGRQIGRLASGEERRDLEQRLEHVDAHDAAVAEVGVERGVGAGERAGMRERGFFAERRAAELVGDDRLARRMRLARRACKTRGVAHRLEKRTMTRGRVRGEKLDQLAHADVGFVADGNQLANPRPRAAPRESSVPSIVPLCDTMLVLPAGSDSISSTAFTLTARLPGTITPMLFGPSSRTPSSLARATSFFCRSMPAAPASANPPLKMLTTAMPRFPHSSSACSTSSMRM